jgi:hypothetical protein
VEGLQRDIRRGGLDEAPGFGVEEEFHAARGSGGCQIKGAPSGLWSGSEGSHGGTAGTAF